MMKKNRLPLVIMLIAGAITSILTFLMNYPVKDMLLAVLIVLIIFYILGSILKWILDLFEKQNREAAMREGEVIEKESEPEADNQKGAVKEDAKEETGDKS